MQILVGELAQLYGLSNQTLHYYEDKGILKPNRDALSGYRYYDSSDLQRLGTIKKYRNAGFSLQTGVKLCEAKEPADIAAAYRQRHGEVLGQLSLLKLDEARIREELDLYERYLTEPDSARLEELEGFYRFEVKQSGEEIIFQDEAVRREAEPWFSNIFYTSASERYYTGDKGEFSHYTRGMLIERSSAVTLNIPVDTPNVQDIAAGSFVTWMMAADSPARSLDTFAKAGQILEQLQLKAVGAPFTRTTMACRGNPSHSFVLRQILVPVEK